MINKNPISNDVFDLFNAMFETILRTSSIVLGDIHSIGIRFGGNVTTAPEHMIIIYEDRVFLLSHWESNSKITWRYDRRSPNLLKNNRPALTDDAHEFTQLIIQCLDAIDTKKCEFSKDIDLNQIESIVPLK